MRSITGVTSVVSGLLANCPYYVAGVQAQRIQSVSYELPDLLALVWSFLVELSRIVEGLLVKSRVTNRFSLNLVI